MRTRLSSTPATPPLPSVGVCSRFDPPVKPQPAPPPSAPAELPPPSGPSGRGAVHGAGGFGGGDGPGGKGSGSPPPRLLQRLRDAIRVRHYSIRTEAAYVDWARRFIRFHGRRHPAELGPGEVAAFLTHLAVDREVAPSTQNQAKSAILFLYRDVLELQLPWLDEVVAAQSPRRLPVVLTSGEARRLLAEMNGTPGLLAALLYGTGMRLLEGLRLRVKDLEFERREIVVRHGKGGKDRVTVLPENLILPLQQQLARAKALHDADLAAGFGEVLLPDALALKYPQAARAWGWQWVRCAGAEVPAGRSGLGLAVGLSERHPLGRPAQRRHPPPPPA